MGWKLPFYHLLICFALIFHKLHTFYKPALISKPIRLSSPLNLLRSLKLGNCLRVNSGNQKFLKGAIHFVELVYKEQIYIESKKLSLVISYNVSNKFGWDYSIDLIIYIYRYNERQLFLCLTPTQLSISS